MSRSPGLVRMAIREAIVRRPELRYRGTPPDAATIEATFPNDPYRGFCYIATQVFCHLIRDAVPWCDDSGMHYWAVLEGERWDLTSEQFDAVHLERIYSRGRPTKFKTLCSRATELLGETVDSRA